MNNAIIYSLIAGAGLLALGRARRHRMWRKRMQYMAQQRPGGFGFGSRKRFGGHGPGSHGYGMPPWMRGSF